MLLTKTNNRVSYFKSISFIFNSKQKKYFRNLHERFKSDEIYEKYQNFPRKIAFFGTDNFSLESLKALYTKKQEGIIETLHVVTQIRKPYSPVFSFCMKSDVPFIEWPLAAPLEGFEMGVLASFGHLLPQDVIKAFPLGILNVHGSLLPRWRGSSPITHAILNGDKETGITMMNIHPHKFDVGEIVYQKKMPIVNNVKSQELTESLAKLGAECLIHCLSNMELLDQCSPQPTTGIINAPKIKKEDSEILWHKMTPDIINSMYLAYDDHFPLWSNWHGDIIKFRELVNWTVEDESLLVGNKTEISMYRYLRLLRKEPRIREEEIEKVIELNKGSHCAFGQVLYLKKQKVLRIKCLGGYVDFKNVVVVGKRNMTASDFQNGFISKLNFIKRYFY